MTQQWQVDLESWVAGWDAVRDDAPQQEVLVCSGEAGSFDAPMGDYSRFEVDEWGHPWCTPP